MICSQKLVTIDPARVRIQLGSPSPSPSPSPSAAGGARGGARAGSKAPLGVSAQAVLQEAARALDAALKRMCGAGCVPGDHALAVTINATSAEHDLSWDSDESYRLHVTTKGTATNSQSLLKPVAERQQGNSCGVACYSVFEIQVLLPTPF